jgi:hypothetical protein
VVRVWKLRLHVLDELDHLLVDIGEDVGGPLLVRQRPHQVKFLVDLGPNILDFMVDVLDYEHHNHHSNDEYDEIFDECHAPYFIVI